MTHSQGRPHWPQPFKPGSPQAPAPIQAHKAPVGDPIHRAQFPSVGLQPRPQVSSRPRYQSTAPPVYRPEGVRTGAQGAIQQSKKQRAIRAAKIYSGQHGGMWYPSGSSSVSDKAFQEYGMTAHELFSGPPDVPKTKENIEAYWSDHPTITRQQLAARWGLTTEALDNLGVRQSVR
jgi:hypothetical protein